MHDAPLSYGDGLLAALHDLPSEAPAAALMRHSVRGPVTDLRTSPDVQLTPEGVVAARRFGQGLPAGRPVRLVHSPIERCAQTARAVAEGFVRAGGSAEVLGPLPVLGAPYVQDFERLVEASGRYDPWAFVRVWFDGRLPAGIVLPADEAARGQLDVLGAHLAGTPGGGLTLLVSHDWNVMLLRERLLGVRHDDAGWLDYLDGVVLAAGATGLRLRWRDAVRRVEEDLP
jgi:broad specificity phosphatase PhoE